MIIVSDCLTDKADEGTIKIASKLARLLKDKGAKIFQLKGHFSFSDRNYNVNKVGISYKLINDIKKEHQDVLYIPNASMTKGICVKVFLLHFFTGRKIFLLPVYRREISCFMRILLEMSKTELVVLSQESYDVYRKCLSNKVHYIKAGVDIDKFSPITKNHKAVLRDKYGFDRNEKLLLHVGHMVEARNLRAFLNVSDDYHVVLVVSTSTRWDEKLYADLLHKNNITIVHEYIANIEEYYQMADAYVFLVENIGCVDVPLSVLEAASCNIPVVSTKYGELNTFRENKSFVFVDDFNEINTHVKNAISNDEVNNRAMVLEYDWKKSVDSIKKIFKEV